MAFKVGDRVVTPRHGKPVEILGIMQARKWQVGSLNEFRAFFNLKTYKTFEEINPDPYVASTLRKLYDHPDLVEMYPGSAKSWLPTIISAKDWASIFRERRCERRSMRLSSKLYAKN